jgi:hypothetical protein
VAEPFYGMGGVGEVFRTAGEPYTRVNSYDSDRRLRGFY